MADPPRLTRRQALRHGALASLAATAFACGREPQPPSRAQPAPVQASKRDELVVGPGAWCWFQSPRAALDGRGGLWLGSSQGTGAPRPGSVDVTHVDVADWRVVARHALGVDEVDDHTSPSVLPIDGGLQVGWAAHRRVDWLEIGRLGAPLQRIHRPAALESPGRGMSYVSAHLVDGRRWVLYRGEAFSWNLLTSADGDRWEAHGLVVRPEPAGQRPYVIAAAHDDGLHLLVSDGNPTEHPGTGVGHARITPDLAILDTQGHRIGAVGTEPPTVAAMTRVVDGRDGGREELDTDVWCIELRIVDGAPVGLVSVRDPWPAGSAARVGSWRHGYRRLVLRDGRWQVEHVGWAGSELYTDQPDYSGLASVHPHDPDRVVVSTDVHPSGGVPLRSDADGQIHHELFSGVRGADGTWTWTALTEHSTVDHLRPVIVADAEHELVAWMRGDYRRWKDFDTEIVVRHL